MCCGAIKTNISDFDVIEGRKHCRESLFPQVRNIPNSLVTGIESRQQCLNLRRKPLSIQASDCKYLRRTSRECQRSRQLHRIREMQCREKHCIRIVGIVFCLLAPFLCY